MTARRPPHSPDPRAREGAVVRLGEARFTVLTDRLLRMEWAEGGRFEDAATLTVVNRSLPVPDYRAFDEDGWRVIETGALRLRYREGSGRFETENLEVRVRTGGVDTTWRPGTRATGNLGGTVRTLDQAEGPVPLGEGLVSRDGWAVVDDSGTPLLVEGAPSAAPASDAGPDAGSDAGSTWGSDAVPWVAARPPGAHQDLYLLGYGHDYTDALGDWAEVAGRIPLPPRFAFGVWWSRYWAYTDAELLALVDDFHRYQVPLDVLVVDMDWHHTFELRWGSGERDAAGQRKGWTGYTWNPTYFPDPEAFLAAVHERGLRATLNLHPASGIQPWEAQYPAMARALGVDPAAEGWIPFRIEDRDFARAYFEHVIHPLEDEGVDFWWLDWQQWAETAIPGLTPTMWLNHVFFTEMERRGRARPLLFHRYGGLGSHRYQVGFSGDAASTWAMLAFEPEFTATAANVLYGYWSHDIGGHEPGPVGAELYTRWIQFGALSPVLRTHTTKNADAERRIWAFPPEHFEAMRGAMLLRTELVPYLYTAARAAWDTGVSMVRPLYYGWPDHGEAYDHPGQYLLGDDLLVNPVTAPADPDTGLVEHTTWLPPGAWVEWGSGVRRNGPARVARSYRLDEIPLWVRAGAVLPMQEATTRVGDAPRGSLVATVFPGADGTARLYEDAGNDTGYQRGEAAWTALGSAWSDGGRALDIHVEAVEGAFPGMPPSRALTVRIPHALPPMSVVVHDNGVGSTDAGAGPEGASPDAAELPHRPDGTGPGWCYDGARLEVLVRLPEAPTDVPRSVRLTFPEADEALLDGAAGTLARVRAAVTVLEGLWPAGWPPESLIALGQTGRRIELDPTSAVAELGRLRPRLAAEIEKVRKLASGEAEAEVLVRRALALLGARG